MKYESQNAKIEQKKSFIAIMREENCCDYVTKMISYFKEFNNEHAHDCEIKNLIMKSTKR